MSSLCLLCGVWLLRVMYVLNIRNTPRDTLSIQHTTSSSSTIVKIMQEPHVHRACAQASYAGLRLGMHHIVSVIM